MSGPAYWPDSGGTPIASGGVYFDGTILENGHMVPFTLSREGSGSRLTTMAHTTVNQQYWLGGNQPINMKPMSFTLSVQVDEEVDYWAVREAADRGMVVEVWVDWPITDWWYVPGGDEVVTEWRTSRPLPYGKVSGVSQSTRPPKVWIDAVSQTVNTSGSASSGVVVLPDTDGYQYLKTITLAVDSYTWIKLRYHPMLLMSIRSISEDLVQFNDIRFELELLEHLGGIYAPADAGGGGL